MQSDAEKERLVEEGADVKQLIATLEVVIKNRSAVCSGIIVTGGEVRAGYEDDARALSHSQQHSPRLREWRILVLY